MEAKDLGGDALEGEDWGGDGLAAVDLGDVLGEVDIQPEFVSEG